MWLYPFRCRREVIATVKTDHCGNFCVWVPRFDIDWVLRFRRRFICHRDVFIKPNIGDILVDPPKFRPFPEPDPPPFRIDPLAIERLRPQIGAYAADRLLALQQNATGNAGSEELEQLLQTPAIVDQPPLLSKQLASRPPEALAGTIAAVGGIQPDLLKEVQFSRYIGPFWRCELHWLAEWHPVIDVPDITFRVTQDVNGDGTEEVIYSENYFDVRWNSTGPIPNVTLQASDIAIASVSCDVPDIPCGNVPAITQTGLMRLEDPPGFDPYLDNTTGYARRPNRPHPGGAFLELLPKPLAETPFCRTLQLYGCNRIGAAVHYRILHRYDDGPEIPFVGLTWPIHRPGSAPGWQSADTAGWYPILNPADGWDELSLKLLLNWPTGAAGKYTLTVQLGDAAKNPIAGGTSAPVTLMVDNTAPIADFVSIRWRPQGGTWSDPLPMICPTIHRPKVGNSPAVLEFEVTYTAAAKHFRSAVLSAGGCGSGVFTLTSSAVSDEHWHTAPANSGVTETATYSLPGTALPGAYSFTVRADSRAFNPAGGDGGFEVDWNYDPLYIYTHRHVAIAIVD
jgi:hypothetical protein